MPILINEIHADIEPTLEADVDDAALDDVMALDQDENEIVAALEVLRQRQQRLSID